MKKTVAVIAGTRPEAVKLCPVLLALRDHAELAGSLWVTAQHRQMLDQALEAFGVTPDTDLDLMRPGQTLCSFMARALEALDAQFAAAPPDLVLVQGDTATTLAGAMAAFYHRIPVGHVEAGLRTGNLEAPWPEEANRLMISRIAALHFAPTGESRDNLLREGAAPDRVFVTGNTGIDALLMMADRVRRGVPEVPGLPPRSDAAWWGRPLVLVTLHRRESFGEGFERFCGALAALAAEFPGVNFVYPVHLNPNVRGPVNRILAVPGLENVHLIEPLDYPAFVSLMDRAQLILTDSGGVQEEASTLGKPTLVLRETTERPEAVAAGALRLVGTDPALILAAARAVLSGAESWGDGGGARIYGDGAASPRIVKVCADFLRGRDA